MIDFKALAERIRMECFLDNFTEEEGKMIICGLEIVEKIKAREITCVPLKK